MITNIWNNMLFLIPNQISFIDHHQDFVSNVESNCPIARCDCLHYRKGDFPRIGIWNLISDYRSPKDTPGDSQRSPSNISFEIYSKNHLYLTHMNQI